MGGTNTAGQVGDGTTTQRSSPAQVAGLSGIAAIAAGGSHTLALRDDGTVWAWGYTGNGNLGDGTTTDRHPRAGPGPVGHGLALRRLLLVLGTVRRRHGVGLGLQRVGNLGDGTATQHVTPVLVAEAPCRLQRR